MDKGLREASERGSTTDGPPLELLSRNEDVVGMSHFLTERGVS